MKQGVFRCLGWRRLSSLATSAREDSIERFCLTNCLRGLHQDRIGGALRSAVSRRRVWGPPSGIDGEGASPGQCVRFVPCWETFRLFDRDRALRGQTETRFRDRSLDAGCDHSAWQTHFLPAATGRRRPQPICDRKAVAFFSPNQGRHIPPRITPKSAPIAGTARLLMRPGLRQKRRRTGVYH